MEIEHKGRGGARPNSGRKKGKKVKTMTVAGSDVELNYIKKAAEEKEKSVSRFVVEELVPPELWHK